MHKFWYEKVWEAIADGACLFVLIMFGLAVIVIAFEAVVGFFIFCCQWQRSPS